MSSIDQFRDAITNTGITPPDEIIGDGELHRFSSSGRRGDTAGWYVFREGNISAGAFGDFRTGLKIESWIADIGRPLTAAERAEFQKKQAELKTERQIKREQLHEETRAKAYGIGRASIPADTSHPYLARKNVGAHGIGVWEAPDISVRHDDKKNEDYLQIRSRDGGLRVSFGIDMEGRTLEDVRNEWESILLIPMIDDSGSVQSFQFISKNGEKKFLYGGKAEGSYFPLGDYKNEDIIMIAEGYATAATIHEVTGRPVVVAYNAGNLMAVAQSIRAQRPDARIILCADDDWKTQRIGRGGVVLKNPGVTDAKAAAEAINGEVIIPEFGSDRPDKATDFNDMANLEGKAAVTAFFTKHYLARENDMTQTLHDNDNDESYASFSRSNAAPQPEPSTERPPTSGRVFTGTITDFGPAPYKKNPNNSASYFITVANGEDEKTLWGIDLGKALVESGFTVGNKVAIYDKGKNPVQVVAKTRDATGKVIREETKTVNKGAWYIGSLEEYVESRRQMAQEMAYDEPMDKPDAGRAQREAAAAAQHPAAPRSTYRPAPEPEAHPKLHFLDNEFSIIQEIWKNVPRQAVRHSEYGYDLLLDNKSKVRVTHDRIEMARKAKQRPDSAYIAACEHARHFWNSEMEVQGDIQHRVKAYAYASVYSVRVTNYTPNDRELIEVNKIISSLQKEAEPGFRRPASVRPQAGNQPRPSIR
jgi:phage/plasmid primase-like uncharacterized protein